MRQNPYNHIDMRVSNITTCLPFYKVLLGELGFKDPEPITEPNGTQWANFKFSHGSPPSQYFGLTEEQDHVPNNNCVAFQANTREEIDRIAEIIKTAGAQNIEGPCICHEYSPTYYAVFFQDPSGNRLEICHMG